MRLRDFRTTRRVIYALGALFAVGLIYLAVSSYLARRERLEAFAEVDRLDPGWRWDDLNSGSASAGRVRNRYDCIVEAVRLTPPIEVPRGSNASIPFYRRPPLPSPEHMLPDGAATDGEHILRSSAAAFREIETMMDLPPAQMPRTDGSLFRAASAYDPLTVVKQLLFPRFLIRLDRGDMDGAAGDLVLIAAVGVVPAQTPSLMHCLIAVADRSLLTDGVERLLAQGEPSGEVLAALSDALKPEVDRPVLLPALRGERAWYMEILEELDDGRLTRSEVAGSGILSDPVRLTGKAQIDNRLTHFTGRDFCPSRAVSLIRHYTTLVQWCKESPDGLKVHEAEWAELRASLSGSTRLTADMLSRYADDADKYQARLRCAFVALAAEQFRRDHGRWPDVLQELTPRYLSQVPRDVYDVRPLKLARRDDGLVIYCCGPNGKDDGGTIGPVSNNPPDVGIRLWDVAQRRQPPIEPDSSPAKAPGKSQTPSARPTQ
jgi:hypothetical protein